MLPALLGNGCSDNKGSWLDSIEVASSSLDRRTKPGDSERGERGRRKRSEGNKHQSRPSCLQRQTSDSSVAEYGDRNYRNENFELI